MTDPFGRQPQPVVITVEGIDVIRLRLLGSNNAPKRSVKGE